MSRFQPHTSKKPNPATPGRAASTAGTGPSPDNRTELPPPRRYATEPTPLMYRRLGRMTSESSTYVRLSSSPPTRTSTPPLKSTAENDTSETRSRGMIMPLPVSSGVFLPNLSTEPVPEISSSSTPVPNSLTESWNLVVKGGPLNPDLDLHESFGAFRMHGLRF